MAGATGVAQKGGSQQYTPVMDGTELASVPTRVPGNCGLGIGVWSTRAHQQQSKRERVEQGPGDANHELVTFIDSEGEWVETQLVAVVPGTSFPGANATAGPW